jgi:hypothetical protein
MGVVLRGGERGQFAAAVVPVINCFAWAAWLILGRQFHITESLGPIFFWSMPLLPSSLIWALLAVRAPRGLAPRKRIGGALVGVLATAIGCPFGIATGVMMAFGAFFPLFLVCFVLEILLLWLSIALSWALAREAFGLLEASNLKRALPSAS